MTSHPFWATIWTLAVHFGCHFSHSLAKWEHKELGDSVSGATGRKFKQHSQGLRSPFQRDFPHWVAAFRTLPQTTWGLPLRPRGSGAVGLSLHSLGKDWQTWLSSHLFNFSTELRSSWCEKDRGSTAGENSAQDPGPMGAEWSIFVWNLKVQCVQFSSIYHVRVGKSLAYTAHKKCRIVKLN